MAEMAEEADIILKGNKQLWTLLHLKYRKHVIAEPGGGGESALRTGRTGRMKSWKCR